MHIIKTSAILSVFSLALHAEPDVYKESFGSPLDLKSYVFSRFEGNTDSGWDLDTYVHTGGPFAFSQGASNLNITTKGYYEWAHVSIELPDSVYFGENDTLEMDVRVSDDSKHDSAWVKINIGSSENQLQDAVIFNTDKAGVVKKGAWTTISAVRQWGASMVSHIYVNINAGWKTGPLDGWWEMPNDAFNGTLQIDEIRLDGSLEAPVRVRKGGTASQGGLVEVHPTRLSYRGPQSGMSIEVFGLDGRKVAAARKEIHFQNAIGTGTYLYKLSQGSRVMEKGMFKVINY